MTGSCQTHAWATTPWATLESRSTISLDAATHPAKGHELGRGQQAGARLAFQARAQNGASGRLS
eukprot:15468213-Alexandrium_andersonii.AAC.1